MTNTTKKEYALSKVVLDIWEFAKKHTRIKTQERMLAKIINGMDIIRAVKQEGIMMGVFRGDVSLAQQMAIDGHLTVSKTEPLRRKGNFKKEWQEKKLIEQLEERNEKEVFAKLDQPEAEIIKQFIPRPKNKKQ